LLICARERERERVMSSIGFEIFIYDINLESETEVWQLLINYVNFILCIDFYIIYTYINKIIMSNKVFAKHFCRIDLLQNLFPLTKTCQTFYGNYFSHGKACNLNLITKIIIFSKQFS
jgi:hypothetical protein